MRLDPNILEEARKIAGFTNDDQLGGAIGVSATTVRNYRAGRTAPHIRALAALRKITGRPFESMLTHH